jgi:hypothetical protein
VLVHARRIKALAPRESSSVHQTSDRTTFSREAPANYDNRKPHGFAGLIAHAWLTPTLPIGAGCAAL